MLTGLPLAPWCLPLKVLLCKLINCLQKSHWVLGVSSPEFGTLTLDFLFGLFSNPAFPLRVKTLISFSGYDIQGKSSAEKCLFFFLPFFHSRGSSQVCSRFFHLYLIAEVWIKGLAVMDYHSSCTAYF